MMPATLAPMTCFSQQTKAITSRSRTILRLVGATALLGVLYSPPSLAAPSTCLNHYPNNERPTVAHQVMSQHTKELCFSAFGIFYSGQTKTPLWSAYKLTPERIRKAARVKRADSFKPYTKLPREWRAELADYSRTGFDRGHLAPFAIMDSVHQGEESFYLTNIVPQHAAFNRGEWSSIESRVRNYAKKNTVYVITGALFLTQNLERVNQRVLAPSHMYKLVYDPRKRQSMAFVATNKPKTQVRLMNAQELEQFSKGSLVLPAAYKQTAAQLMLR